MAKDMVLEDVVKIVKETVAETVGTEVAAKIEDYMKSQQIATNPFMGQKEPETQTEKGSTAARTLMAFASAQGNTEMAKQYAAKHGYSDVEKLLTASDYASAGVLIPENVSDEIIELLLPATIMRSSGCSILPMTGGNITLTREDQGPQASYIGETLDTQTTTVAFSQEKFTEKELTIMIPISNKLIRNAGPKVEAFVKRKMLTAMIQKEDAQFLRGVGGEFAPKGLKYWIKDENKYNANATVNVANVTKDLLKGINLIRRKDVQMTKGTWGMNSTSYTFLMSMRDGLGALVFAPEMSRGTLFGYPFKVTSQIPYNLGSGSDESEIYLYDAEHATILDVPGMDIVISNEASYKEGNTLVSAFSRNETLIKMNMRHDFGLLHRDAAVLINAVKWNFA